MTNPIRQPEFDVAHKMQKLASDRAWQLYGNDSEYRVREAATLREHGLAVWRLLDQLRADGQPPREKEQTTYRGWARRWLAEQPLKDPNPEKQREIDQRLIVEGYEIIDQLLREITQTDTDVATLRQQLAQAQDEAQENWQSVKKRKARAEAMLQALKKINALPSELAGDAWAIARAALAEEKAKR